MNKLILSAFGWMLLFAHVAQAKSDLQLWYAQPAAKWEEARKNLQDASAAYQEIGKEAKRRVDAAPLVRGDAESLRMLLDNLLENAARHAPDGSTVSIELAMTAGQAVILRVADHGRGVDAAHRDDVFEAFWRGADSNSSGLGLAIVRAVVAAHGGSIAVVETPGGGATFEVCLPARQDAVL